MLAQELAALFDRDLTRLEQELRAFPKGRQRPRRVADAGCNQPKRTGVLLSHFNYHLGQIDYLRRFTSGAGAIQLATL